MSVLECLYLLVLFCLSAHGFHRLYLLWILFRRQATKEELYPRNEFTAHLSVCIQLPIYNEHNVVERLLEHVLQINWPKTKLHIQVLDDSTDQTSQTVKQAVLKYQAQGFSIEHIHRTNRAGYKAGALQEGLAICKQDLIAIFDADFLPPPSFLIDSVPLFFDPKVALVQHRWTHINREENLLTQLSSILLDGHFIIEHTARYRNKLIFNFNGTAGIWRKEAIVSAGGWKHHTITEDLELSYRVALNDWKFIYLCDKTVPAELPAQTRSFKAQQLRWAKGAIQTAKLILPEIFSSKLTFAQKREALVHLCSNLAYPLTLLFLLLLPFAATHRQSAILEIAVFGFSFLSICFFYGTAIFRSSRSTSSFFLIPLCIALGAGLSVQQTLAVFSGFFGNDLHFVRTPKSGLQHKSYRLPKPQSSVIELMFGLYTALSAAWLAHQELFGAIPIVLLFSSGFFYLATTALLGEKSTKIIPLSRPPINNKDPIVPTG
ncbi:MAG: glycosyl transferase family 2 [Proteobacteria bacterium]|nr:glycosyl transferase family 2 [Pseudomonadota bacterium]